MQLIVLIVKYAQIIGYLCNIYTPFAAMQNIDDALRRELYLKLIWIACFPYNNRLDYADPALLSLKDARFRVSSMSYKHNNLMAMRQNYWDDAASPTVQAEKQLLRKMLIDEGVFADASLEDTQYFFFTLPSIIIVKAHALGFQHSQVKRMLIKHIHSNRAALMRKSNLKILFKM